MRYTLDENNTIEKYGEALHNVLDNGSPTEAYARPRVSFSDECEITGGEFRGGVFRGGWLPLQIQGSSHFVNIPNGINIKIGCQEHDVDYWLKNYERIGKIEKYSDEQIAEYKLYIDLAATLIERNK